MRTITKVLLATAIIGGATAIYFKTKVDKTKQLLYQIKTTISKVSNVKMDWFNGILSAKINVQLYNPTNENITGLAKNINLKRILFYHQGQYYGSAETNINGIEIEAGKSKTYENIPVVLQIGNIINTIGNLINGSANFTTVFDTVFIITYGGKEYEIKSTINFGTTKKEFVPVTTKLPNFTLSQQDIEFGALNGSRGKVCKNRIKCSGIDKNGKLKKHFKFQRKTGNIVRV